MDLTSPLQSKVYEMVDRLIGGDSQLNAAVKASLLKEELQPELLEKIELKLAYNNYLVQNELSQMVFTLDVAGNVVEVENVVADDIDDASGGYIENFVYVPEGSPRSP